jgi:hypothetical protein
MGTASNMHEKMDTTFWIKISDGRNLFGDQDENRKYEVKM